MKFGVGDSDEKAMPRVLLRCGDGHFATDSTLKKTSPVPPEFRVLPPESRCDGLFHSSMSSREGCPTQHASRAAERSRWLTAAAAAAAAALTPLVVFFVW